jgi:large subunit ribosomal protein L9
VPVDFDYSCLSGLKGVDVKIILTENIPTLGEAGEVVEVADGYARNYLIPQEMAMKATPGALKQLKLRMAAYERREERMIEEAQDIAERLEGVTLTFEVKAGEKGRLYGSITPDDIAEALQKEIGVELDRHKHLLFEPLRQVGKHTVPVRLTTDIETDIDVILEPESGEWPEDIEEPEELQEVPEEEPSPSPDVEVEEG